jgi:15-hydroxyprostaglandin dehydrogenase (NAD)
MSKKGAIITGAASGVGLALTKHYLAQGWRVVMSDINPAGEAIAKELGDDVLFIPSDTSSWESQAALFEKGESALLP